MLSAKDFAEEIVELLEDNLELTDLGRLGTVIDVTLESGEHFKVRVARVAEEEEDEEQEDDDDADEDD